MSRARETVLFTEIESSTERRERNSGRFPTEKCEEEKETKTKHASGLKREKRMRNGCWNRGKRCVMMEVISSKELSKKSVP